MDSPTDSGLETNKTSNSDTMEDLSLQDDKNDVEDDIPPVHTEVNLDDDDLGVSEINLDDDDDIFKSARLEPEPAKMVSEPEVMRSNGGREPVLLTNGHHKEQAARAESEEPVETDIIH